MTKKGFTLLEILLSVGAMAILAAVVIVAINPSKQLATARNTTRLIDAHTIADAIYQYTLDHDGVAPAVFVSNTYTMLGTAGSGCATACAGEIVDNSSWNNSQSFGDQSASDFNAGTFNNVIYDNVNSGLKLTSGASGDFTSRSLDSGSAATNWLTFSWTPQFPAGKELPNNSQSESGYPSGNANMGGNKGLWHLNEISGVNFSDVSGNNLTGTCVVGKCPVLGSAGILNTAPSFNGANKECVILGNTLNDDTMKNTMTVEGWFKASASGGGKIRTIISKAQFGADNRMFFLGIWSNGRLTFLVHDDTNTHYYAQVPNPFVVDGKWHHLAGTWNQGVQTIYYDGVQAASSNYNFTKLNDSTASVFIGAADNCANWYFDGALDEIAVYNRALNATEIKDHYLRGATRLKFQVRSCADNTCTGRNFAGPDVTASTFYSELSNTTLSPPSSLSLNNLSANKYFQYKAFFESDSASLSALLKVVNVSVNVPPPAADATGGDTADACLDLNSALVGGGYVANLPFDPKQGSVINSYYAVKATDHGKIIVKSCRAELGQDISTVR